MKWRVQVYRKLRANLNTYGIRDILKCKKELSMRITARLTKVSRR
jgi:hypothetical protein